LREAKARQKESGTRENLNRNLKEKKSILAEVKKNIAYEIKYLNRYYNFEIEDYHDPGYIYAESFLLYFKDKSAGENISDLITGFEILGIGISIHEGTGINIFQDFRCPEPVEFLKEPDNNSTKFTLELLFGDIFYSRAVSYFMRYSDFKIFEEVLDSLLSLHLSRIILYRKLIDSINVPEILIERFKDYSGEIKNLNAVLNSSFAVGLKFSGANLNREENSKFLSLADSFSMLKSFKDIKKFLNLLKNKIDDKLTEKYEEFMSKKIEELKNEIKNKIEFIKDIENKNLFMKLLENF